MTLASITSMIHRLYRIILPESVDLRKRRLELTFWAFLLSLSFYPGQYGVLAWVSLIRPLMILSKLSGRDAFYASFFFSYLYNLFCMYWIAIVTPPGMVAAVALIALYYAVMLFMFNKLYRIRPILGILALPFLWVGVEYFRVLSEFAFPWADLGYTQSYFIYVMQIVSLTSVHGLSFLIVLVNVLLWQLFRSQLSAERRLTALLVSLGIVSLLTAYGWIMVPRYPEPGDYKISLLQGSVPLDVKWKKGNEEHSFQLYDSLTQSVEDSTIKLFIWPETSVPCYFTHNQGCRHRVSQIARDSKAYHLVGAMGALREDERLRYFNSCYQISPTGVVERRHDKTKLVPFAEHVPYQDYLPFLQKDFVKKYLAFIDNWGIQWWSDYYPGDSAVLFDLPEATYGVLICFETAFPDYVRSMIRSGAHFIVGITNDTWFGESVGIHQHSRMFITRAIENRCWFARCANSGLTYIVDPYGRVREDLDLWEVGALSGSISLLDEYSVYTKYGDLIGLVSFLITCLLMVILFALWIFGKVINLRR